MPDDRRLVLVIFIQVSKITTEQHTPNPDVPYTIHTMTGFARYSLMKSFCCMS